MSGIPLSWNTVAGASGYTVGYRKRGGSSWREAKVVVGVPGADGPGRWEQLRHPPSLGGRRPEVRGDGQPLGLGRWQDAV